MELKATTFELDDKGIAKVIFNSPPANTLSMAIQEDIEAIVNHCKENEKVRVLVFTSANPKIFIAGADLGEMGGGGDYDIAEGAKRMQDIFNELERLPIPTIAAINGHALGGGCEFALACDIRIMGGGTIGLTEVSLGLLPAAGGTQRMTRLVGEGKATELMLLGSRLKAEEAESIGLIQRVVPEDKLEDEAMALAGQLANGAVQAMGFIKETILAANQSIDQGLEVERNLFAKTFTTGEAQEGLEAFFKKRPPNFLSIPRRLS